MWRLFLSRNIEAQRPRPDHAVRTARLLLPGEFSEVRLGRVAKWLFLEDAEQPLGWLNSLMIVCVVGGGAPGRAVPHGGGAELPGRLPHAAGREPAQGETLV
jgi:hypothetical protein